MRITKKRTAIWAITGLLGVLALSSTAFAQKDADTEADGCIEFPGDQR